MRKNEIAGTKIHELKTDTKPFQDIYCNNKLVEVRLDDREYEVYDYLLLRQTQWTGEEMKNHGKQLVYTGRFCMVKVLHIHRGIGMKEGYVAMSFVVLDR